MGSLFVEPALDYLQRHGGSVRLGQRIEEIAPSAETSMAVRIDGEDFSHIVWACHPGQLGKLAVWQPWLVETATLTASYTWQPILTTWLQFSAPLAFPYPLLGLKCYPVGTSIRVRLKLAGTDQFVNLDGEVKWVRPRPNEDLYEIGIEFQRLTSQAVLSLIRHLYGRNDGIPTTVA